MSASIFINHNSGQATKIDLKFEFLKKSRDLVL